MRLPFALALAATLSAEASVVLHTVRIDAIASDSRGEIVTNLTAGDFELREGGEPRTVESV